MKIGFYPKLAFDGIRKNKRMYVPYILTCIGMIMMNYIFVFLQTNPVVASIKGGGQAQDMLSYGSWIVAFFSCIFLFYTHSFLLRRRKKEFGLYNILGMGKKNIGMILIWETIIIAVFSFLAGIFGGIILSKVAELGLVNVMKGEVTYSLSVSMQGIIRTAVIFGVVFILLFFNAIRQVAVSSAISLLRSENEGEKPPKANWLFGILGAIILGVAYYIAITIEDPISALAWFLLAVILVMIATYLIMISTSVLLCRILQRNKNFYYKSSHFVSVSSMAYRMKRNGAGLASICILATMVLVMLSSTTALFMGEEDMLYDQYPGELNIMLQFETAEDFSKENIEKLKTDIDNTVKEFGTTPNAVIDYRSASIAGLLIDGVVEVDQTKVGTYSYSDVFQFYFIPLEDYNEVTGENRTLDGNEALCYMINGEYGENSISFNRGNTYQITEYLDEFIQEGDIGMGISSIPTMALIVSDAADAVNNFLYEGGEKMYYLRWEYAFDTELTAEEQQKLYGKLSDNVVNDNDNGNYSSYSVSSREAERWDFYGIYGGLFYLGIILSVIFLLAAVLIIYYKQISEGYEDQSRFKIMQKVGMTKKEIRKIINSQIMTIFYLPLFGAGLHLLFAFPIIEKILLMFRMENHILFVGTTVGSFLLFALFYGIVYKITSNAYYNIVSGAKEER